MSATTTLEFTLTSPGNNPSPTPDNNNSSTTPTTPSGTTTIVSYPNTGENSSSGDSASGSVFMALFAIIGLAALAIFLVKYLKKNRRISFAERGSFHLSVRPRVFATAGLVLAVALLGSMIISKMNEGRSADAAEVELNVTAAEKKIFNVKRGEGAVLGDTVKVENNGAEYKLYVSTTNNKFCLDGSTDTCLSSVDGNLASREPSNLSSIRENQWGVSLLGKNDISAQVWGGASTSRTLIYTGTASDAPVQYAVKLGTALPDGTYHAKVTYTAYSTANPEIKYTVITHNGYVGTTGESTQEDFKDGVQVWIRQACGEKKFIGWRVDDGDLDAENIKTSGDMFYFVMPASDVELTALCEGDTPTPSSKWVIKYDKNISTATGTMNQTDVTTESVNLSANTFALNNSTFKGWSCTAGKPFKEDLKNFDDKASVTEASLKAAGCNPTTTDNINTYTVYALWKPNDPEYIQDVTAEYCDSLDFFDVKSLKDKRVETSEQISGYTYETDSLGKHIKYSFAKYADGRCWMLQDLAYEPKTGQISLTADTTDVASDRPVNFSTSGASTSNAVYYHQEDSGYSTLYNFKAATAGAYDSQPANTTIGDSLCPTSWKLPDSQNDAGVWANMQGELYGLHHYNIGKGYGGGSGKSTSSPSWEKNTFLFASNDITLQSASDPTLQPTGGTAKALNFKYSGARDFSGSGSWPDRGTDKAKPGDYASYFTSTIRENGKIAAMNPHKSGNDQDLLNGETDPKEGSSVRCVLRTAKQRTAGNRNVHVHETDITDEFTSPDDRATYNQTH